MVLNFPGPSQLRIFYTTSPGTEGGVDHVLNLNFEPSVTPGPGDPFADIDVVPRVVAVHPLSTVTDEVVALLRPLMSAVDCTIVHAECWRYPPASFDAQYISSYPINLAATGAFAAVSSGQNIYTFRTIEGGILRVFCMEAGDLPGPSLTYADMNAANQAFVDYFTDDASSMFLARDTSYPAAFLKLHPGQSEAIFKNRNR